jgi:starch synthase
MFATAEYETVVKLGGLGEASRGLVVGLRRLGLDVEVVLPDYGGLPVTSIGVGSSLRVAGWVGEATVRMGRTRCGEEITLIRVPGIERIHPYNDPHSGRGWADNDQRFFAFSAAVAALADERRPDLIQLNDWHTAIVPGLSELAHPTVLTIHNAAYQGSAHHGWIDVLRRGHASYLDHGDFNPLAGGVSNCDRVIAVSHGYAEELRSGSVANLTKRVRLRGVDLIGIRNGIDTEYWDPSLNPHLTAPYRTEDPNGKEICRKELLRRTTLSEDDQPVIAVVSRMVEQKGIDLALDLAPFLESVGAKLVMIGDGEVDLVARAARTAGLQPDRFHFIGKYTDAAAAWVMAGADLLFVPSRFEPCGLTQMQAMRLGTIPIVTAVGGLADTVVDADLDARLGNGFVARQADTLHALDALHRAVRAIGEPERRHAIQRRGMSADWSWAPQAERYADVYRDLLSARS